MKNDCTNKYFIPTLSVKHPIQFKNVNHDVNNHYQVKLSFIEYSGTTKKNTVMMKYYELTFILNANYHTNKYSTFSNKVKTVHFKF